MKTEPRRRRNEMKEMIAKRMALKGKDQKGFTLVEVIVVLVILAILMAIAVPALTGYIDKAKHSSLEAQAATIKTALQVVGTDTVSHGGTLANTNTYTGATSLTGTPFASYQKLGTETTLGGAVSRLTGASPVYVDADITNVVFESSGTLKSFSYTNGTNTVSWDGTKFTVS
jgi:type IV pilus assembly protein PilA